MDWGARTVGAKKARGTKKPSPLEERLAQYIKLRSLPAPVREFRFAPPRLWRFDSAWPGRRLAIELEGGVFIQGRHSRGLDMSGDCEKYGVAALLGWTVLRFTVKHFESGWIFQVVDAVLSPLPSAIPMMLQKTTGVAIASLPLDGKDAHV